MPVVWKNGYPKHRWQMICLWLCPRTSPARQYLQQHAPLWPVLLDLQGREFPSLWVWTRAVWRDQQTQQPCGCSVAERGSGDCPGCGSGHFLPRQNTRSFLASISFPSSRSDFSSVLTTEGNEEAQIITAKRSLAFCTRHQSSMLAGFKESLGDCRTTAGLLIQVISA